MDQLVWSLAASGRPVRLGYKSQTAFSFLDLFSPVLTRHVDNTFLQNDWPPPRLDGEKVWFWELTDSNHILRVELLDR